MITTTKKKLYLTALSSLNRLELQFVPDSMQLTRSAEYGKIQVVGRNNPLHHYTTGSTNMNLNFDFIAGTESREDVKERCRWLESLAYNESYEEPPERIRLTFGKLFRPTDIWLVTNVQITYTQFDQLNDFEPFQATVSLQLALDSELNKSQI